VFFPAAMSAAPPVLDAAAGDEVVELDVDDEIELELGLGLEELEFAEITPPWTTAGAELFVVLAAAATKASKVSPEALYSRSALYF
jgi:hypothetical protein